jgi:acyl-CoA synthetase (AMP-forming)/AMP-acid ligase II
MNAETPYRSPFDAFAASAGTAPDAPFLIAPASAELAYAPDGFRIGYGKFKAEVDRLRAEYAAAGYGRGARVALLLENRPVFFLHWLALNALGVAIVPINPDLRPDELSFQMDLSKADLLIAASDRINLAKGAALGRARLIDTESRIPPCQTDVLTQDAELNGECALLFTSGSTGKPKGCLLSNRYFLQVADWYLGQGGVAALRPGREINLTPLPMFHMNALGCSAVGMMLIGGAVVPLDRFHASRWWPSVADSGATVVHCLGVIPAILLQLPASEAERRHAVRFAFAPGVDVRHRAIFEERYGIPIVDAWAMTETGGAAATTTAREPAGFGARCIGRPAANTDYRLVDDRNNDVPRGTPGELLVRSRGSDPRAGFFSGYLNEPAATEEAWQGGWFHTGDYVSAGADELLYFFDRKKSIVRRSGENIAVLEVESAMQRLPSIQATAVTPVPDELRGEEVFAFVVKSAEATKPDAQLAEEIVAACADSLAYHKVPGYVAFIDSLPLSSTKKLARGEIKTLAAQAVNEETAFDLRAVKAQLRKTHSSERKS